ncbi:MAG: transcriptional repressor [Firmicutes bacterium HGW-Firmicutes-1]|jgi:Fur family peroxide stress response transcriptional regulator|nr:MAG: transcriptional repressor [Firmicutes bacterium HGW-Firmicutes-1]
MEILNNNISTYLLKNKIKPSYQRIKIMQYLVERKNHPTVEKIHSDLVNEIPTLSKTTVYNTLTILMNANIAKSLTIHGNELRYDADIQSHGHFMCSQCETIYDFNIDFDNLCIDGLNNFQIDEKSLFYKGICEQCLKNKN